MAGFGTKQEFLQEEAKHTGLVADLDPGAKSLEGYLFPDTYRFARKATPAQITAAMVKRFRQVAAQLGLRQNVHEVVTMASLIERETAVDGERRLVASVFENRLAAHMPLMTDPSVIYGLELDGMLERDDSWGRSEARYPRTTHIFILGYPRGRWQIREFVRFARPWIRRTRDISILSPPGPTRRANRCSPVRLRSTIATLLDTGMP